MGDESRYFLIAFDDEGNEIYYASHDTWASDFDEALDFSIDEAEKLANELTGRRRGKWLAPRVRVIIKI